MQLSEQESKARHELAQAVREGLSKAPKRVPSRFFYDALGSHLFEAICQLPWYKVTRGEQRLLRDHGPAMVRHFPNRPALVELGCGSGEKIALLAEQLATPAQPVEIHLIDISATALELSERTLSRLPGTTVKTHCAAYEAGLRMAANSVSEGLPLQVLFLGSNIGNFGEKEALDFLTQIRSAMRPGDGLLLGTDLVKSEPELLLAYSDPLGVTSAFNLNLLDRINRELGADFDIRSFEHRAVWNAESRRLESHLVSSRPQTVRIPALELEVTFAKGEHIWTESSHKYTQDGVKKMGLAAGLSCQEQWVDADSGFCVSQLVAS